MRKSEKTIFLWPKVVFTFQRYLLRHRPDFRKGLRFLLWAPEVHVLRVKKATFTAFPHFKKGTSGARNENLKPVLKSIL